VHAYPVGMNRGTSGCLNKLELTLRESVGQPDSFIAKVKYNVECFRPAGQDGRYVSVLLLGGRLGPGRHVSADNGDQFRAKPAGLRGQP
jgi:hypothetical protein